MSRYTVVVYVTVDAKSELQAADRVRKAQVCLENSLSYAKPVVEINDAWDEAFPS